MRTRPAQSWVHFNAPILMLVALSGVSSTVCSAAAERKVEELPLPPALEWAGTSAGRVVAPTDPWITPGERSGFEVSPSYAETMRWIDRLVAASPV